MKGESGMGMLGASQGGGPTSDAALLSAAQAVAALNTPCDLSTSQSIVTAFQNAWNANVSAGGDMATASATGGSPIGGLTSDGKYGPDTAQAVAAATGGNAIAGCTSFTNGGGGQPPAPPPGPGPIVPAAPAGMSTAVKGLIYALIVGAVGVVGYILWRRKKKGGARKARETASQKKRKPKAARRRKKPDSFYSHTPAR